MNLKSKLTTPLVASALAVSALVMPMSAHADPILAWGQTATTNTITGTANGAGTATTVSGTMSVLYSLILGPGGVNLAPQTGSLTFSATCAGATVVGTALMAHCSGTFAFTNAALQNVLSGSFIDLMAGTVGGHELTLGATTPPPGNVSFTSDLITTLGLDRAISFGFTNVLPSVQLCGTTICSFTAAAAGTASANIGQRIPEPATLALLGIGLLGLALSRRKQR